MLLDGALSAMAKAKGAIERKDLQERTDQVNKASDIVMALRDFLDHEKGGELASNLDALYDYILRNLMQANRDNDADKIQEAMGLMLEVKSGWRQMEVPSP